MRPPGDSVKTGDTSRNKCYLLFRARIVAVGVKDSTETLTLDEKTIACLAVLIVLLTSSTFLAFFLTLKWSPTLHAVFLHVMLLASSRT